MGAYSTTIGFPVKTAFLPALVVLALAGRAVADDGRLDWHTIESAHFVVHYHDPNEDLARRVATVAERAHEVIVPVLGHAPAEKTPIVVTDDTDGANGFASVVPRNRIQVYATAPGPLSTLNDHDDWMYGLVAHEYTHIIHLDTIGGIPWVYNQIFGKTWAPNQVQPRWFIEGLATYEESKRSSGGRTRSAIFDMYLRGAVLAGTEIDLAQMSTGPLDWPHGNAAYLYGSHFVRYIADRYGDEKLEAISKEYGRHPIPFGINRAIARVIGRTYEDLYDDWLEHMLRKYELQRDAVDLRGRIEGRKLSNTGESNFVPQYSPDGKEIWWVRSDGRSRTQYRRMPVGGDVSDSRTLYILDGAGDFRPFHDGSGFVFERGMTYRTFYDFGDIYVQKFGEEEPFRLTWGARAEDPDVSPDGQRLVFTVNGASRTRVVTMPVEVRGEITDLWAPPGRYDQVYSPVWSPDGTQVAVSVWTTGGYHDIWIIDVATRTARRLTADRAIDTAPCWSQDGRWIYFTSDRTGIYNVYAASPDGQVVKQVTNVLGGTFTFDVSRDGKRLVYQGFDEDGYELWELELDEAKWLDPEIYVDDRPRPVDIRDGSVALTAPRDYDPLETLAPNQYTITMAADTYGSTISVGTSASDIIGRHAYSLAADYYFDEQDVGFGASYSYTRFWPSLRFSFGRGLGRPSGLVIDGRSRRYTQEGFSATLSMALPVLRRPATSSDVTLSYEYDYTRSLDEPIVMDPDNPVPRLPELGESAGMSLRWSLSNTRRWNWSLGPAEGRNLSASLRFNHPALRSDNQSVVVEWRWQEYFTLPWWGNVISLRYAGGVEQTDRGRGGRFSVGGLQPFGSQSLGSAIVNSTRASVVALHGYPPGLLRGRQYHLLTTEYRVPLVVVERGLSTVPVYIRRLHVAALADAGIAADDIELDEIRPAIGASLRLDVVFGYYAGGTFDLGIARGLGEGGITQYWLLLTQGI